MHLPSSYQYLYHSIIDMHYCQIDRIK